MFCNSCRRITDAEDKGYWKIAKVARLVSSFIDKRIQMEATGMMSLDATYRLRAARNVSSANVHLTCNRICNCHRHATKTFQAECDSYNPGEVCHVPVLLASASRSLNLRLAISTRDWPFNTQYLFFFFYTRNNVKNERACGQSFLHFLRQFSNHLKCIFLDKIHL